jgi:hypothetical protein
VQARPVGQGYTYEECGTVDAEALRAEIEGLALEVFAAGTADIDIGAVVSRAWVDQGMDAVVDGAVAAAVDRVRANADYWSRFLSGWSVQRASAFATAIAEDAFASPEFTTALEALSAAVAADLTDELETMTALAGSTALLCLQEYVGDQYSATLYELFTQEITAGLDDLELAAASSVDVSALDIHGKGLTGLSVIIVSQLVRRVSLRLSREVGERVAGRVVGRVVGRLGSSLVPLAGWLIGAGLIVWDLVEGSQGALPQIEQALTSPEVKAAIADELAIGVKEELGSEMQVIAGVIANDMVEEWRLFCTRYPYLCSLPEENESFRVILDTTPVQELAPLSGLVDAYMETMGRLALEDAVATGLFERMLAAPSLASAVIRSTESVEGAAAWLERAGDDAGTVLASGVYAHFAADELNDEELAALLALGDPDAVAALAELSPTVRRALLDARPADVSAVVKRLPPDELAWLVDHAAASAASLPRLIRDVAAETVTTADLRARATAQAEAAAAAVAAAESEAAREPDPTTNEDTASALGQQGRQWLPDSPILAVALVLLLILAGAGLFIRARYGINRY